MDKKKLIIYGAGNRGKNLYSMILASNIEYDVVTVVDNNKAGCQFSDSVVIQNSNCLMNYANALICITVHNSMAICDIRNEIKEKYNIEYDREIEYEEILLQAFRKLRNDNNKYEVNKEYKILFDAYMGLGLGGIESWLKDICTELVGKYPVRLFCDSKEYPIPDDLQGYIDIINRQDEYGTEDSYSNFCSLCDYFENNLPCTIITNRCNVELLAAVEIKKRYPELARIISVIHIGTDDVYKKYALHRTEVDLFVGVSEDIKEGMLKNGISKEKVCSIKLPFSYSDQIEREYSLNREKPIRIGYSGRFDSIGKSQKRMDLVLKCIETLKDKKVPFVFSFAGDGSAREDIEKWIKEKDYSEHVYMCGRLTKSEVMKFWENQDICLNLADFEGRSLSILEAMGNGAVPVVTRVSGVAEDITHGVNGVLVELTDYQSAVENIERLESDRFELQRLGENARNSIKKYSSLEYHVTFWKCILENNCIELSSKC